MTSPAPLEPAGHRDGAFGLCRRQGRVLLVRNARVVGGRRTPAWDLPGGAVRPGERLDEALAREWREETGLEARVGPLLLVVDGAKRRAAGAPPLYTWRAFTFEVAVEGEPRPGPGIEEAAWVPLPEAAGRLEAPWHGALRLHLGGGGGTYGAVAWVEPAGPPAAAGAGPLRPLLALAAAAAVGERHLVEREVAAALAGGEPPARIEETLLQVVPYAGFPRALAAFAAARPRLGAAAAAAADAPQGEAASDLGREAFGRVYGEAAGRVEAGLRALHAELPGWTLAFAYGRVIARPGLTLLERELLAVSILAAMGGLEDPLLGHARAALRLGAPRADVLAAADLVAGVAGEPRRDDALRTLDRA